MGLAIDVNVAKSKEDGKEDAGLSLISKISELSSEQMCGKVGCCHMPCATSSLIHSYEPSLEPVI